MRAMTPEAVKRLALQAGGALLIDGKNLNAARTQSAIPAKRPAPQAKPPDPEAYMQAEPAAQEVATIAAAPDSALVDVAKAFDGYAERQLLINEQTAGVISSIKSMLEAQKPTATEKRPSKWVFRVARDARGLMETITATAS